MAYQRSPNRLGAVRRAPLLRTSARSPHGSPSVCRNSTTTAVISVRRGRETVVSGTTSQPVGQQRTVLPSKTLSLVLVCVSVGCVGVSLFSQLVNKGLLLRSKVLLSLVLVCVSVGVSVGGGRGGGARGSTGHRSDAGGGGQDSARQRGAGQAGCEGGQRGAAPSPSCSSDLPYG